jgi:hypothetical protein
MHGKLATVPTVLRVAVLVVVLLCASGVHCRTPVADEYAVKRYLRQRDAWLKQRFPTNDSTLDADIAAFALPEHESTVREASVTECKRQFVITYERARAGELPLKFEKYCEKPGKSSEIEPEAPTIFFIESDRGLQRATATIRAQTNKGVCIYIYIYIYIYIHTHTHTHTRGAGGARAPRYVLAVEDGGGKEEEDLRARANAVASQFPSARIKVATAAQVEATGGAYELIGQVFIFF